MILSSADIFFQNQFVSCCCFFGNDMYGISEVCQAVWVQIIPGPDLGPNCLQR